MDCIGPQRFQPKSLAALKAEVKQMAEEFSYAQYLGLTREQLKEKLGEPSDISIPPKNRRYTLTGVFKYRNIEYHFDIHGLVYTDTDEKGFNVEPRTLAKYDHINKRTNL